MHGPCRIGVGIDQLTVRNIAISRATLVLPDGICTSPLYVANGRVASACPRGHVWELELPDHLVFPGLINAHDHLHLNSIPPLPQHPPFPNSYAWIAAFQSHLASSAVVAATSVAAERRYYHGGLKNLLAGATTVLHHDPWQVCLADPAFPVRVLRHFGWSHSLGMGLEMVRPKELPRYGPPVAESFAATPAGEPWIIHLAEGTDELAAGELSRLDGLGCLAPNTVLVHGVGLSEPDIELLLARGAAIIWCPSSNLAILGRTLEPRRLFDAGRLALGTDSRLSGVHDLLTELRVAAAYSDLSACELFRLVTAQASRVLRAPFAGGLGAGQHADLLVLRDRGSDPYEQLLAATRGELRAVLRDGVPAIADPEFAGWFAAFGLGVTHVKLDGYDKLLARARLGSFAPESLPVEPGLEW
jgi:cytosine/adenosine deaminase-related metal-dependent hydrolase